MWLCFTSLISSHKIYNTGIVSVERVYASFVSSFVHLFICLFVNPLTLVGNLYLQPQPWHVTRTNTLIYAIDLWLGWLLRSIATFAERVFYALAVFTQCNLWQLSCETADHLRALLRLLSKDQCSRRYIWSSRDIFTSNTNSPSTDHSTYCLHIELSLYFSDHHQFCAALISDQCSRYSSIVQDP